MHRTADRHKSMCWRAMRSTDLPEVNAIADLVHVNHPEDDAIPAERQRLYPEGCYVLAADEQLFGYLISHPWHYGKPPPLNSLLRSLPERPTTYYLHDIALLPDVQALGEGRRAVEMAMQQALSQGYENVSLVAVNHSTEFWIKQGFSIVDDGSLAEKLHSYGPDAHLMVSLNGDTSLIPSNSMGLS